MSNDREGGKKLRKCGAEGAQAELENLGSREIGDVAGVRDTV